MRRNLLPRPLAAAIAAGAALVLHATLAHAMLVKFVFRPVPAASAVTVAGTFNDWNTQSFALAGPDSNGVWSGFRDLPQGRHAYKFVVDGARWFTDLTAGSFEPDGFGGRNSVMVVGDTPHVAGAPAYAPGRVPANGGLLPLQGGGPFTLDPYPERRAAGSARDESSREGLSYHDFVLREAGVEAAFAGVSSLALVHHGGYIVGGTAALVSTSVLLLRAEGSGGPGDTEIVYGLGLLGVAAAGIALEARGASRSDVFWAMFATLSVTDILGILVTPAMQPRHW